MGMWEQVVEILRGSILVYAQACGGNLGGGILIVTLLARLALFPLTLRMARASATQAERMRALQPELDALRQRHQGLPPQRRDLRRGLVRDSAHSGALHPIETEVPAPAAPHDSDMSPRYAGSSFSEGLTLARASARAWAFVLALETHSHAAWAPNESSL